MTKTCKRGHLYEVGKGCKPCDSIVNKIWRQNNLERARGIRRKYYNLNKEKVKNTAKRWHEASPEKYRESHYKSAAKKRRLAYALDFRHFADLISDVCFYCGSTPDPFNGVDRVDNNRGYESNNVVTACVSCNLAKGTRSRKDFEAWVVRAATHITNHGSI